MFFPAYFCLSPLLKACEKSSQWLWKESSVGTGVRQPGNTCVYHHDMTLAVKVALNPNITNQLQIIVTFSTENGVISVS